MSVIRAETVSPAAQRLAFHFATALDGWVLMAAKVGAYLRGLLAYLPEKVMVVRDNGPNHDGPLMQAFVRRNKRVTLVRLPP